MKTQVAIIGAGPAGMLLSELLAQANIASIVVDRQSRAHILSRIRAGVLEPGTVQVLRENGLANRMDAEGHPHDGMRIVWAGQAGFLIDIHEHLGQRFMAYGQTSIQRDLFDAADARGATLILGADDVALHDIESATPSVSLTVDGRAERIDCEFIAGCDGFHGVSRQSIPRELRQEFEKVYPFGWLGVLSETRPLPDIIYANHPRGFALASMRSPSLSRYYIQVPLDTDLAAWPDTRFWDELRARYPDAIAREIETGPSIEKSIAPLRSFVSEPMQHGRLFLAGDAAHIVPPTGAKGLNLAVSDVYYLNRALRAHFEGHGPRLLETYGETALRRVWHSMRTSWYLTNLLHRFPDTSDFDQRAKEYELRYLQGSRHAQAALAEQYAGLPLEEAPAR